MYVCHKLKLKKNVVLMNMHWFIFCIFRQIDAFSWTWNVILNTVADHSEAVCREGKFQFVSVPSNSRYKGWYICFIVCKGVFLTKEAETWRKQTRRPASDKNIILTWSLISRTEVRALKHGNMCKHAHLFPILSQFLIISRSDMRLSCPRSS